ncbi:hypothetical protein HUJ05_007594 [Dendroctonus ponderosae]|nr:hypothetical protein HUJ05_007594 [Dendroctonus ponderosae]
MRLPLPCEVQIICYADDLAVFVASQTPKGMIAKTNYILNLISKWMEERDLQIAPKKTRVSGFQLDRRLNMTRHIKEACLKAEKSVKSLKCFLPNIRGPSSTKRRVLGMVCQSIVLYGASAWSSKAFLNINKIHLNTTQRNIDLRVCSAYCTVSGRPANVVAGLILLHLMVEERKMIYELEQATEIDKQVQRERTLKHGKKNGKLARKIS